MIPERLLPLIVTLVRPVTGVDRYGNTSLDYGTAATRTPIRAWVEQQTRDEVIEDGRAPLIGSWLLITNHGDVKGRDRIEWDGDLFEVAGPPAAVNTPAGAHHIEATLRRVEG
jgi:hypothetical protein